MTNRPSVTSCEYPSPKTAPVWAAMVALADFRYGAEDMGATRSPVNSPPLTTDKSMESAF